MVEWKKIGEICTFSQGIQVPISEQSTMKLEGYSRFLRIVDYTQGNEPPRYVPINDRRYWISKNEIAVVRYGTPGYVCRGYEGILANNLFKVNINNINDLEYSFLTYVLKSNIFQSAIKQKSSGGALQAISFGLIRDILIPIPSLKEQNRIVGILDTFTASIENLKEQITQRRKQFKHYRDQLLDLEGKEGVERIILKDVCEVINGRAYSQPELLSKGKYRILRVGNFFSNDSWYYSDLELEDKYYCEKGDLLYAWSASFGPHIWEEEKVIYHYHIWKMNCSAQINKKFMFYWLQSEDMRRQAFSNLHGATMAHLTKALMESLMVSVPSLSDQSRIVSILDTFEASIANLEAQLSQREKQYEYYRNKLLTFE